MGKVASKKAKHLPIPVRFGKDDIPFLRIIEARANAQSRSVSGQLKYYARLGLIAEDNPDLPLSMIAGILEAREELKAGLGQPYQWGVLGSPWPIHPSHQVAPIMEHPKPSASRFISREDD